MRKYTLLIVFRTHWPSKRKICNAEDCSGHGSDRFGIASRHWELPSKYQDQFLLDCPWIWRYNTVHCILQVWNLPFRASIKIVDGFREPDAATFGGELSVHYAIGHADSSIASSITMTQVECQRLRRVSCQSTIILAYYIVRWDRCP